MSFFVATCERAPNQAAPAKPAGASLLDSQPLERGLAEPRRYAVAVMKAISLVTLVLGLIVNDAIGFEAGAQLYPEQKHGLEFELIAEYSNTTGGYDISVVVERKGKLRKLDKLQLAIASENGSIVVGVDDLNIRRHKEKLTINRKLVEGFVGAKFHLKSQYLDGASIRLQLPGFVYIARLKDFVHDKKA
jgi:hypothetical protein